VAAETVQERLQMLSDEILKHETDRALWVLEHAAELAPFGHRSALVKGTEASLYLARKVGEKPPSDRLVDEEIANSEAKWLQAAYRMSHEATRALALKDTAIGAKKREWQALFAYGRGG
jgi:hypothetical protein